MCRALYMQMTEKGEIPAFSRLRDRIEARQAAGLQDCRIAGWAARREGSWESDTVTWIPHCSLKAAGPRLPDTSSFQYPANMVLWAIRC